MKTLRQAFGKYSEAELVQLAQWWGVSEKPGDGWQQHPSVLASGMHDAVAARFAWEQLDADGRQVLHTALTLSAPDGVLRDVLFNLSSRVSREAFEQSVATLQEHLLLVDEQVIMRTGRVATASALTKVKSPSEVVVKLGVPKDITDVLALVEREIYTPKQDRSTMKLEQILASMHGETINMIGQRYSFNLYDYFSRADTRARLVGQLEQPEVPQFAWEQFDAATRKLIKWLAEAGGTASMQTVREHTGYDNPTLARCIHKLEAYAIAFDAFVGHERRLFVPHELLKNLKKAVQQAEIVEESGPSGLIERDDAPALTRQLGPIALYDLATITGWMYQQNIEPTQSGYVPKRIANKLNPQLQIKPRISHDYGNENVTLDMLFNTASEMGLLKLSRAVSNTEKARYVEGASLKEWAEKDTPGMVRQLLENWQQSRYWIDIAGANYSPYASDSYYMDYHSGRKALISHLQNCTPGRWYTLASLLRTIKEQTPYALRHRYAYTGVAGIRNAKSILAKWYQADGEIFSGLISSTLFDLGIVALGFDQPGANVEKNPVNPTCFMVTDLGAEVLQSLPDAPALADASEEKKRTLIVQPNSELLLLQPDWPTLFSLLPFAQLNQAGIVSRLTLTRASFLRALAQGRHLEDIQGILAERSQKEVPQNVAYNLTDWVRAYKEITFSQVYLIEIPNENLANEIVSSGKLKSFGLRRLAPCVLAASNEANLQELRRAFEKEGIVVHILGDIIPREKYSTSSRWR